jgi:hypothetical protein
MSAILVTRTETIESQQGDYFTVELTDGKRALSVVFSPSPYNPIHVLVLNASHKAYRGTGRQFQTVAAAIAGYKTEGVQAMIRHAAELRATATMQGAK